MHTTGLDYVGTQIPKNTTKNTRYATSQIVFLYKVPDKISQRLVLDINTLITFSYAWIHIEPCNVMLRSHLGEIDGE